MAFATITTIFITYRSGTLGGASVTFRSVLYGPYAWYPHIKHICSYIIYLFFIIKGLLHYIPYNTKLSHLMPGGCLNVNNIYWISIILAVSLHTNKYYRQLKWVAYGIRYGIANEKCVISLISCVCNIYCKFIMANLVHIIKIITLLLFASYLFGLGPYYTHSLIIIITSSYYSAFLFSYANNTRPNLRYEDPLLYYICVLTSVVLLCVSLVKICHLVMILFSILNIGTPEPPTGGSQGGGFNSGGTSGGDGGEGPKGPNLPWYTTAPSRRNKRQESLDKRFEATLKRLELNRKDQDEQDRLLAEHQKLLDDNEERIKRDLEEFGRRSEETEEYVNKSKSLISILEAISIRIKTRTEAIFEGLEAVENSKSKNRPKK